MYIAKNVIKRNIALIILTILVSLVLLRIGNNDRSESLALANPPYTHLIIKLIIYPCRIVAVEMFILNIIDALFFKEHRICITHALRNAVLCIGIVMIAGYYVIVINYLLSLAEMISYNYFADAFLQLMILRKNYNILNPFYLLTGVLVWIITHGKTYEK